MRLVLDLRLTTRSLSMLSILTSLAAKRSASPPAGRSRAVVPFIHPPHGVAQDRDARNRRRRV